MYRESVKRPWIPAFAGMTSKGNGNTNNINININITNTHPASPARQHQLPDRRARFQSAVCFAQVPGVDRAQRFAVGAA